MGWYLSPVQLVIYQDDAVVCVEALGPHGDDLCPQPREDGLVRLREADVVSEDEGPVPGQG